MGKVHLMGVGGDALKYEDIDAINYSTLKLFEKSAAYAQHMIDHPDEREDKPHLLRGRAIHCAILEPEKFRTSYTVPPEFFDCAITTDGEVIEQPSFGDLRYKKAKDDKKAWISSLPNGTRILKATEIKSEWYENLPKDTEVLSGADHQLAVRCSSAVQAHHAARELLAGAETEKIIEWTCNGRVKCKSRLDALTDRVIDIKTTRYFDIPSIEREIAKYNYHAQMAFYQDAATSEGLIKDRDDKQPYLIFICCDPKSSFVDVIPFELNMGVISAGRELYQRWMAKYYGSKRTGMYPGACETSVFYILPEWKVREDFGE
jgi:hypothetical protein